MSAYEIRKLTTADAALWREIRLEALRLSPRSFSTSYEEAVRQDAAAFTQHIPPADSRDAIFGAFLGDTLNGVAGLRCNPTLKQGHKGLLWGVYVRASARQSGLGRALVAAALDHARHHVALVQLSVAVENTTARPLYERLGFASYGIERRALRIDGVDHDDMLMAIDFANGL